ncbi:MAG TPA: carboxylesterase family protein [Steroidobacteraceae bacterium]|nr:carboxylesterase family protein [Steroidobacteraceae bacterium]
MNKLISLSCVLISGVALAAGSGPVVRLSSGALQGGTLGTSGAVFKGIPFAAPPIGALRWREPMPVAAWHGVRAATRYQSACAQANMGWNASLVPTASEDCLYLNVWTPRFNRAAHLPVMVWIHGGAFAGGSGTDPMFDGGRISARGVVLVTLNYRLGILGFFSHPQLGSAAANFGLRDQIAALKWVRENIARFGGDPAAVTLFGQSAGGGSVVALMTSPLAQGLFHSAIVESGVTLGPQPATTLAAARATGQKFAGTATLEQLRALSTQDLLHRWAAFTASAAQGPPGAMPAPPPIQAGPVVDGQVLPQDPAAAFAAGHEQQVPLIIGNNAREGFGRIPEAQLAQIIQEFYGPAAAAVLPDYAPSAGTGNAALGTPANQWLTDTTFRCGAIITAERHRATGAPVFSYQFEQSLPGHAQDGAQHSFELPYVFGNLLTEGVMGGAYTPSDRALSDVMVGYWTQFAKTGDPNGAGLPQWPQFDPATHAYLRFATSYPADASPGHGLRQAACKAFEHRLEEKSNER